MQGINIGEAGTLYDRMLDYPFQTETLAKTAFSFIAQSHTVENVSRHDQTFVCLH